MPMLFIFLSCLLTSEVILTIETHAADLQDLPSLPTEKIPKALDEADLNLKPAPAKKPQDLPQVNSLMGEAVAHYTDLSSVVYQLPDLSWDLVFLEAVWILSTLQKPTITVTVFEPGPDKEVKLAEQERVSLREANLTFAYLVGVTHAFYWEGAHLEDVAAFVEKASGFKKNEFQQITAESFATTPAYHHNVLMILARLMGYQMAKGSSVKASLNDCEQLYSKTLVAQIIKEHRQSENVNLEALFTRISLKFSPLFPSLKNLFKKQRQNLTGQRVQDIIWESKGINLYTSVHALPNSSLWALPLLELSQAFDNREPKVMSYDDSLEFES